MVEYVGEALELEEATRRRAQQEAKGEMTFLMVLSPTFFFFITLETGVE